MASRTVECRGPEGLTAPVTLQLALPGVDALTTTIAMTEGTFVKGRYTGTLTGIATATYDCNLIAESNVIMVGVLDHVNITSAVVERVVDETLTVTGGAYTVTVTVTNVSTGLVVQGATVKIKDGTVIVDSATTNVSGVATPTANAGTYTLVVSYPGVYASSSQALVVDADEVVAVALTPLSITAPAAPNLTTGYVVCYGTDGLIEVGVLIYAKMVEGVGTDAYSHDTAQITMTSDAAGLAQHTGFVRGAKYVFSRGTAGRWTDPEVAPNAATWALPEILGYS